MTNRPEASDGAVLGVFAAMGACFALGAVLAGGPGLTFPSNVLGPGHLVFLAVYMTLGSLVWPRVARIVGRAKWWPHVVSGVDAGSDGRWMGVGALLTFLGAAAIRLVVYRGLPVVDDEYGYLFSARLLASGHLSVPSPALRAFFDHILLVDDGRLYSQYFLGWPALMVPGVWLGVPGFTNAVIAAGTLPAVFLVSRRLAGRRWARVSAVLYGTSPAVMYMAATSMSHTSCLGMLAWCGWAVLRSRDAQRPWWVDGLVALTFAAAFFNRPTSAIGCGLALLLAWSHGWWMRPRDRARGLMVFAAPAVVLGALFLAVNAKLNGGVFKNAYSQSEQDFIAHYLVVGIPWWSTSLVGFARANASLWIRLVVDLFGWPVSFIFLPRAKGVRMIWGMLLGFYALNMAVENPGLETLAPSHFFEMVLPLLWLTVRGASAEVRGPLGRSGPRVAVAVGFALAFYHPYVLAAIGQSQTQSEIPWKAAATVPPNSVIFVDQPIVCPDRMSWVIYRPLSAPSLDEPVVFVNHLTADRDRRLMREVFPDRGGFVLTVDGASCTGTLHDLGDSDIPVGGWFKWLRDPPDP